MLPSMSRLSVSIVVAHVVCILGAQSTGFIGVKPLNKDLNLGEFYATFEAESQAVHVHDKTMISMDSIGRREWYITPSPNKPGTVVIASIWMDPSEPQGWAAVERLVSLRSSVRWVEVRSSYEPGEYNKAGFRIERNPHPYTFDSAYVAESVVLPPADHISMTVAGNWDAPKFYMCVSRKNYGYWVEDAQDEGKENPVHWGWSGATLNLDKLQPDSFCEAVGVYVLSYMEPTNKKTK
ncbi:hypothetical protein TWF694_005263 [Orbilia ellipsospora]